MLSLRLLPQGSDRSARHLLKLILTFAAGYQRDPAAQRSGVGRATPSGSARDPGSPIRSPFIPFRPWGSRSASPGLPGKLGSGVASAGAPSQGWSRLASLICSATLSTHRSEHLDRPGSK